MNENPRKTWACRSYIPRESRDVRHSRLVAEANKKKSSPSNATVSGLRMLDGTEFATLFLEPCVV